MGKGSKIVSFLTKRNWVLRENEQFFLMVPPSKFEAPQNYYLYIPKHIVNFDYKQVVDNLLRIIGGFYDLDKDEIRLKIFRPYFDRERIRLHFRLARKRYNTLWEEYKREVSKLEKTERLVRLNLNHVANTLPDLSEFQFMRKAKR